MYKVLDVRSNKLYEPDFTILKRLPSRGEVLTVKGNTFLVMNYNTVFPENDAPPYIVIMVKPVDKNFKIE